MTEPTRFPELNAVLAELVSSVRTILGDNFCGAYLQGSFAVGDADEHSDVDFIVVVDRELSELEQRELQALQERLFALPTQWGQHLEGSYVPRQHLRRRDPERRPWFYFDNGSTEPAWDTHDNTAVVRCRCASAALFSPGLIPKTWSIPSPPTTCAPTPSGQSRSGRSGFPPTSPGAPGFSQMRSFRTAESSRRSRPDGSARSRRRPLGRSAPSTPSGTS